MNREANAEPERAGSAIAPCLPSASSVEVSAVCRTRPFQIVSSPILMIWPIRGQDRSVA
jgi:hypothetical protein